MTPRCRRRRRRRTTPPRAPTLPLRSSRRRAAPRGAQAPEADDARALWAFAQARAILRQNEPLVDALLRTMEGGTATVGDCVALVESESQLLAL